MIMKKWIVDKIINGMIGLLWRIVMRSQRETKEDYNIQEEDGKKEKGTAKAGQS